MAPPLAGAVGMRFPRFVGFSILSGGLWVGAALLAGVLLRAQIERLLPQAAGAGGAAIVIILVLLSAYHPLQVVGAPPVLPRAAHGAHQRRGTA